MEPLIRREELPDGPLLRLFLQRSPQITMQCANNIGKFSVENAIKKLIGEAMCIKRGTGRTICYARGDTQQVIGTHDRWYLGYGRRPRKFPN